MKYNWNPAYKLVIKIKQDYKDTFGDFDTYHFETWLERLNKQEYNDVFECLQLNQNGNELLIRYGLAEMQAGMWDDPNSIYRECRSLVIDLYHDEIIVSPFRKFFNLDEVEENKLANIQKELANAKTVEYSDKKDGSMQSARYYNGEIKMYGSMALKAEDSWRLADGYSKLTDNHKKFIQEYDEYTIIFEYISLADVHVVKYKKEEEGLYLIGMRNIYTGQELTYWQLKQLAETWDIPVIIIEDTTLDQILQDCKKFKSHEKEGWVVNIIQDDGTNHRFKLKCDDYVALHRMLDYISSVNIIIENIANGTYDDLLSKVPENYQDRVQEIADQVFTYISDTKIAIKGYYNQAPKDDVKTFMMWVDDNVPKELQGYVRCEYHDKEYNIIKRRNNGYKKAKEIGIKLAG